MAVTKEDWAQSCQEFRRLVRASDDDLRIYTLGALRAVARDESGSLNEVRAILSGLDAALNY